MLHIYLLSEASHINLIPKTSPKVIKSPYRHHKRLKCAMQIHLYLTAAHSKGQGDTHFDCEYLINGDLRATVKRRILQCFQTLCRVNRKGNSIRSPPSSDEDCLRKNWIFWLMLPTDSQLNLNNFSTYSNVSKIYARLNKFSSPNSTHSTSPKSKHMNNLTIIKHNKDTDNPPDVDSSAEPLGVFRK